MRRYRLFEKSPDKHPWFMVLDCIMSDEEDLCIGDDERAAGVLLRWLNEREAIYHIEVNRYDPTRRKGDDDEVYSGSMGFVTSMHEFEFALQRRRDHFDVLIYDDATAALMSLFHEGFKEIIPPEVLAAQAAEAAAAEEKAAAVAAQREREDAENARRIAKGKSPVVSVIESTEEVVDQVAPPTRAWLQKLAHSFNNAIYGTGYEHQRQREKPL